MSNQMTHYYVGGYDYDFVSEIESCFECPICLLCIREPYQTSCGHRFCHSCILTWLYEGKTCPHDNCSLGEGDIFHDAIAHRQILQLLVRCPLSKEGCRVTVRLSDVEQHFDICPFKTRAKSKDLNSSKEEVETRESSTCKSCGDLIDDIPQPTLKPINPNAAVSGASKVSPSSQHKLVCPKEMVACCFAGAGCTEPVPRVELAHHTATQMPHHLQLLWEKMLKMQQMQTVTHFGEGDDVTGSATGSSPTSLTGVTSDRLDRSDVLRLSGSNLHSTQKLIRDLFQRMITLEQKMRQVEISNDQLVKKVQLDGNRKLDSETDMLSRFCNGKYVWKIDAFTDLYDKMRHDRTFVVYSNGFYTSVYGYRVGLRISVHISKGEEFLGVFLHLMRGVNDDTLSWPFSGKIVLQIKNQDDSDKFVQRDDFCETMITPGTSEAFRRPFEDRNPVGFGLHEFIRINSLYSGGFLSNSDILVVKANVSADNERCNWCSSSANDQLNQIDV